MKKLICSICEEDFEDYHERTSDDFILIEDEYGEYYCYNCGNNELEELKNLVEEEPLYYALIKGHELITDKGVSTCKYWNFNTYNSDVFPNNRLSKHGIYLTKMSKEDWNKLGINDSNADLIKAEE